MLTGESITVPKLAGSPVFMGTLITTGHGLAKVSATGVQSEMGKIGKSLEEIKIEPSPSKAEAGILVKRIALIGLTLCLSLVLYWGIKHNDWTGGVLAGITLAMSVLPEEIPIVLAIFTILGAFRMSKKRVLAKRSSVIETLGATTVICLDKTGTITQNKMRITALFTHGRKVNLDGDNLPDEFDELVKYAVLASRKRAVDPVEKAIFELGERSFGTKNLFEDWKHLTEEPLTEKIMAVSQVWQEPNGTQIIALKGAPEAIFELCHLNPFERDALNQTTTELAQEGLRVLAVAKNGSGTPEFLGLLGFSDPIRPAIKNAIKECYSAGIRVVIITGDHPQTAQRIATEVGLKQSQHLVLGIALKSMDEKTLEHAAKTTNIFARVSPSQKLLLVEALKNSGEVVTMIGDGVNDAPAIKAANIGVAMGEHGTDVARESSSLVLLDDNFASVVDAVRLGRRIYANIRKAITYIIVMHFPVAGMALVPVFLGFPPVLFPIHIAIMELFTDPASSIVFESQPEEIGVMNKKPRQLAEKLISRSILLSGILQGIIALGFALATFWTAATLKLDASETRTMVLLTLLVLNVGIVSVNRSWNKTSLWNFWRVDPTMFVFLTVSALFIIFTPHLPFIRGFLKLGQISLNHQLVAILTGLTATGTLLIFKQLSKLRFKPL